MLILDELITQTLLTFEIFELTRNLLDLHSSNSFCGNKIRHWPAVRYFLCEFAATGLPQHWTVVNGSVKYTVIENATDENTSQNPEIIESSWNESEKK